eukprot:234530_1
MRKLSFKNFVCMRTKIRINRFIQIFDFQHRFITVAKPQNTHQNVVIASSFKDQSSKRRTIGHNINAITPGKGGKQFIEYRKQILKCNYIKEIDSILKSNDNFDIKIYTAAIKRAGMLKNVLYCKDIMRLALKTRNLIPDLAMYGTLFHAFNLNNKPFYCDDYVKQMIDIYNLKPNIIIATTLLGGCTKNGNVERANNIYNDIILKYNLIPNKLTLTELIQTYGQNGDFINARKWYDKAMDNSCDDGSVSLNGAMMKAYIANDRIDEALEIKFQMSKNQQINIAAYMPLIGFYLKDKYLDAEKALQLIKDCVNECKFTASNGHELIDFKAVANLKLLQTNKDAALRKIYFEACKQCGRSHMNVKLAPIVLESYLEYYGHNFQNIEVIKCFETFCKAKFLGYWYYDKVMKRWIIDLHGYNYGTVKFVLYYIFNHKKQQLIKEMGFDWIIICGKRYHTNPTSKESQVGMKQFLIKILHHRYNIKSNVMSNNIGRLELCPKDVKRFVENTHRSMSDDEKSNETV